MLSSLFSEVEQIQGDHYERDAIEQYNKMSDLGDKLNLYIKNSYQKFEHIQTKYEKYVKKTRERIEKNSKIFDQFKKFYDNGNMLANRGQFSCISIVDVYKLPTELESKLPPWFEQYKQDELEKHREYLNTYAMRLYRNRVTETMLEDRKELIRNIEKKIEEIEEIYKIYEQDHEKSYYNSKDIPIAKIQELQHFVEELQYIDRVIHEISYMVTKKLEEAVELIVQQYIEFEQQNQRRIKELYM